MDDTSLSQRNGDIRFEKEKKKHKAKIITIAAVCTLVAVAFFAYIINGLINKVYYGFEYINQTERKDSNSVEYKPWQYNILKYSRDGASGLKPDGTTLWNGSYEMNNPAAVTCRNYVIVGDIGGKEAYVYDGTGSGVLLQETLPIVEVDIAKQGVAVVVVEDSDSNITHIYNPFDSAKSLLYEFTTNLSDAGYPVDVSISEDGKKLVSSYFGVNNEMIQNKISFYNFSDVGKEKNYLVGGIDMGQELCPQVEFINNDIICIFGEQSFKIYSMQELPEEIYSESFDKTVKSALHNESYISFVFDNMTEKNRYTLVIYDIQGNKVLEKNMEYKYNNAVMTKNEIIFYSDQSCMMVRFNGETKWEFNFNQKITALFPQKDKEKYILIDDININQIKLTEDNKSEIN